MRLTNNKWETKQSKRIPVSSHKNVRTQYKNSLIMLMEMENKLLHFKCLLMFIFYLPQYVLSLRFP